MLRLVRSEKDAHSQGVFSPSETPLTFYLKCLGLKYSVVIQTLYSEKIHMVSPTISPLQFLSLVYLCFIFRMQPFCDFFPLVFSQYPISTELLFGCEDSRQKISNEALSDNSEVKAESWTPCSLTEALANICLKRFFFQVCVLYYQFTTRPLHLSEDCRLLKTFKPVRSAQLRTI